ncbi:MAG: iron(III) transport system ATP-binding protein [Bradymonadia bacterium]|jgi:iron(III) transport system ATP-binding protein
MSSTFATSLTDVGIRYGNVTAVADASLAVRPGEVHALLGASGAGKTSLLRAIAGFERVSSGTVHVGGQLVDGGAWTPPERRNVGVVFQDYALFPHLTVAKNIAFGTDGRDHRSARVQELLTLVGLPEMGARKPYELSGGEQQRVALARALAQKPAILLLDEPFAHLDPSRRDSLRDETMRIVRQTGLAAILVTHDAQDAMVAADVVHIMHGGRIRQSGSPREIYEEPRSREVATALGPANFLDTHSELAIALSRNATVHGEGKTLLIRPEWLEFCDEGTPADVILARFEGATVGVKLRIGDADLECRATGTLVAPNGSCHVRARRGWLLE